MAQNMGLLTDMWMVDPTMFDPTQASNQFSNYNNQRMPFPPTYNTGAGGPVNAATGKPIQSFLDWQQANPGGMTINATPAQPQAAQAAPSSIAGVNTAGLSPAGLASLQSTPGLYVPRTQPGMMAGTPGSSTANFANVGNPTSFSGGGSGSAPGVTSYNQGPVWEAQQAAAPAPAAPQASGPPNNWYAALNALSNPGNPTTQGATVPLQTGYQPAGGVNQAFLNQAGAGQGMNRNFLGALSAIQGRPQG